MPASSVIRTEAPIARQRIHWGIQCGRPLVCPFVSQSRSQGGALIIIGKLRLTISRESMMESSLKLER